MRAAGGRIGCALLVALFVVGCDRGAGPEPGPNGEAVVVLDGNPIPLREFELYLDSILSFDAEDGPLEDESLDRVRSRLFDAFIDEEILLLEAQRRGVTIEEHEIDAYLGLFLDGAESLDPQDEPSSDPEAARRTARRNLMIQKLRGAVVSVDSGVGEQEVDAYLAEHLTELESDRAIVLRSLTVGTSAQAREVREAVLGGRVAFADAVEVFGLAPVQGQPMEVGLNDLPDEIRKAVAGLASGEISQPVDFQGSVYLFLVDVGPAKLEERQIRARAFAEVARIKSQEASDRFLARLRSETDVELHLKALPFPYIPE